MLPLANLFLVNIITEMSFYKDAKIICSDISETKCRIKIKNIPFDTIEYYLDQKYFNKVQYGKCVEYRYLSMFLDELKLFKDGTIEYRLLVDDVKDDIYSQLSKGFAKLHLYIDIDKPPVISTEKDSFTFNVHGDIEELIINSSCLYLNNEKNDLINTYLNRGVVSFMHGGLEYTISKINAKSASIKVKF